MSLIVVAGALANKHGHGGEAWVRLSYLRGFQAMGFDVHFVEQIDPASCVDAAGQPTSFETSVQAAYFREVTTTFGLSNLATLILSDGRQTMGLPLNDLRELLACTDLLINISGHLALPDLLRGPRERAYIDIDPGFTQFWHAQGFPGARLAGHDLFFTIGENIGSPECSIPTNGIPWRPTRQPVVLEDWPVIHSQSAALPPTGALAADPHPVRFTTVASWRGPFGPISFGGKTMGLKVHEFRKFIDLPARLPYTFEIALNIHAADFKDLQSLRSHGWRITDPAMASTPNGFASYIRESTAEFSVAQGVYVETHSGWFSDRTVRYLASGRPALVQDTGFSRQLPVGQGLLTFDTPARAADGARELIGNYSAHCSAARRIAVDCFGAVGVLGKLLDQTSLR